MSARHAQQDAIDAHLARVDSLLAASPRTARGRAVARAELDAAELLGADREALTRQREQAKGWGFQAVYWAAFCLCLPLSQSGVGSLLMVPVALVLIIARLVISARLRNQPVREALGTRRALSRQRLATDELVRQSAPISLIFVVALVLPSAFISVPPVDGGMPPLWLAWLAICGVPLVYAVAWTATDLWLRRGTVIRLLRRDAYFTVSAVITLALALSSPVLAFRHVHRPGVWFTLFLTQMAWCLGSFIAAAIISSRRKKAATA